MAETTTPNYGWTMPDPGASANTWGATLNATTQKVDAQVFTNALAGVPIGAMTMWGVATPPANWLICDGSSLSTAAPYDKLFAIYGYAYGGSGANFNLPNLVNRFPMGAGTLATTGGEATHVLTAAELAAHTHPATQAAHTHSATQAAHTHSASQDAHTHNASQDAHSHGLTNQVPIATSGGTVSPQAGGWTFSNVRTDAQQPPVHIDVQQPAVHIDTQQPAITVANATPAITVAANTGGDAAHNNLPPYLSVNFIIKFQ